MQLEMPIDADAGTDQPFILIIDDNPITRKMVGVALRSVGYRGVEAESGMQALEIVRHYRPALILQDLFLPDIDGLQLVEQLRVLVGRNVPILACSGSLNLIEQARQQECGFSDFLAKPIKAAQLLDTVEAYLTRPLQEKALKPFQVLIADDDPIQRKLLKIHLTQLGFEVTTAADGHDALAKARQQRPDAIISDVLMPHMDGFRFCMAVRSDPHLHDLPLFLTSVAYIEEDDQQLAKSAGANALLLRTPDFRAIIDALLVCQHMQQPQTASPPPRSATADTDKVGLAYTHRITRQLERQANVNETLTRRLSWIEAELAILAGIAETIRNTSALETILDELLHHCLNALGISKGAIYLHTPLQTPAQASVQDTSPEQTEFLLRAHLGYSNQEIAQLATFFGQSSILQHALQQRHLIVAPSDDLPPDACAALLRDAGAQSVLILPLLLGDEPLGALMIASAHREVDDDWFTVIRAIGSQISQAIGLARAITRMRNNEARLQRIVETVPDGIIIIDTQHRVTFANATAAKLVNGALDASTLPFMHAITIGVNHKGIEQTVRDANGEEIILSINAAPLNDGDGTLQGMVISLSDITASKRAEQEAHRRATELSTVIEAIVDGVVIYDQHHTAQQFNLAAKQMFGWTERGIDPAHLSSADRNAVYHEMFATIETPVWQQSPDILPGSATPKEYNLHAHDGREKVVRGSAAAIHNEQGEVSGAVMVFQDVTEWRRLDQMKDDFMNVASHELRTPLTSLLLASRLIQRWAGNPQQVHKLPKLAEDLVTHAKRMNRLVDDMLDMTHIFSGQFTIHPEHCDLSDIVMRGVAEQRDATRREIVLHGAESPVMGMVDRERLWQVLANLLTNALKYSTPEAIVEVDCGITADERYWFSVCDHGCGISEHHLAHLFERFYRVANVDASVQAQQTDGLGLGLYIAEAIVRSHGGTIRVASTVDRGSTFTVEIPLRRPAEG